MAAPDQWLWAVPAFSGGICLASILWLWEERKTRDVGLTIVMLLLLAWWGIANGAMMLATDRAMKIFFYSCEGLPVLGLPLLLVIKSVSLVNPARKPSKWVIAGLLGLVAAFKVYSLSDSFFTFAYAEVEGPTGFLIEGIRPKMPFWIIFVGVPFSMVALAVAVILGGLRRMTPEDRRLGRFFLIGISFVAAMGLLFYGFGLTPVAGLDPTPSSVGIGGLLVLYATWRFRLGRSGLWSAGQQADDINVRLLTFQVAIFVVIPCGVVFTAMAVNSFGYLTAGFLALMLLAMALGFILLQTYPDPSIRERLFSPAVAVVAFLFACVCIVTLGVQGRQSSIPWALLFPILAIYGLGHRGGMLASMAFLVALAIASYASGTLPALLSSPVGPRSLISFLLITIILSFMEYARRRYLNQLTQAQEELRRHRDSLEALVEQRTAELSHTVERLRDEVAQREKAQAALLEAKEAAEKANRAKTDFLANMSHEFRTPLTHILGFADVLKEGLSGPLTEQQREFLGYVISSGSHLHTLVNDLLDMARVEAGRLELNLEPSYIELILSDAVNAHSLKAREARVELELSARDLPPTMELDQGKINQVITNLLTNAIKFSLGGRVRIQARGLPQGLAGAGPGQDKPHVEVVVADSGIGIAAADIERIFKPFEQVDSSTTRRFDGSGLGLALARTLVEMHGGSLWAESEGLGRGSRFHLVLPWAGAARATA